MKNGIYKGSEAIYFVKDNKVIMKLKGMLYKTSFKFLGNRLDGKYKEPLEPGMMKNFENVYSQIKTW